MTVLQTQDMSQFKEISILELLNFHLNAFEVILCVFHQSILGLEGTKPIFYVIFTKMILLIKLDPSYSFMRVILKHPLYHYLYLYWQFFITRQDNIGECDIAIIVDIVAVNIDFLSHLIWIKEGEGNFTIPLGIKKLVCYDSDGPNIHFLIVPVIF
jgi:hypothetical protein